MKVYCNMVGNYCRDTMDLFDDWNIEDCIHPSLLPLYKDNLVPSYVRAGWTIGEDGVWSDRNKVRWPDGIPEGPTPDDPNYTGPWPIVEEQPEQPSDTPEE